MDESRQAFNSCLHKRIARKLIIGEKDSQWKLNQEPVQKQEFRQSAQVQ